MPWEKSSTDLVTLFSHIAPTGPDIQHKKMFGCHFSFVNGNLFAGLFQQGMTFRLSPADHAAFLDQPDTSEFEPMPGHKMKGCVLLLDPFSVREDELANWMKCALDFASRLPPKEKKPKEKKAPAAKNAPAAKKKRR